MDIFDKIEILSYKLADATVAKTPNLSAEEKKDEKEIWDYFYFMILSQFFTFFFVFLFGFVFDYFLFLFFSMISFCSLRVKSGGYHCDSFKKCFITTNITFLIIGLFSKYFYIYFSDYYALLGLCSFIGAIFIIPSVPLPWGNEESRGVEEDKRFQLQYRDRVIKFYIINIGLIAINSFLAEDILKQIVIGLSSGLILASFSGSVFGSKTIERIWNNL